jgi:hypothetical protein
VTEQPEPTAPASDTPDIDQAVEGILSAIESSRARLAALDPDDTSVETTRERLQVMVDIDQMARGATLAPMPAQQSAWTPEQIQALMEQLAPIMAEVDAQHHPVLVRLLEGPNPFSISTFGEQTARNAWLLVQHSDAHPELQRQALELMKSLPPEDVHRQDLAYLEDRVAVGNNEPQRYGTQGSCVEGQGWHPCALEDPDKVDVYRAEVGLGTLAEYQAGFKGLCG